MRELGVCYYPEHWPEAQWAADAAGLAEAGINWVRIGEFAWSRLEPAPGRFDFGWLDRAIATLGAAGLKVILGTPSATPPRWMVARFPDMLAVDAEGRPRRFGSRRHYCHSHAGYRDAAAQMARRLGQRYGRNSHVAAWQIDNEYGCHDTVLSYSDAARSAFRDWLAQRYQSVDALNRAWGNVFWSMEYASFDEIDLPMLTVTEPNPSHVLAFRRFASDQVVQWNRAQVQALRPLTDRPLIHNYMGRVTEFDHHALAEDLDIASWDSYPIGFLSDRLEDDAAHKSRYLQQGDPDMQAFHHDLYRGLNAGRWWVMEQQPGPVNWAPHNPAPLPGMVRLWSWEAFAHGAEVVSYFRWRQVPFGQEQMHAGLRYPDDTDAPAMAEVRQVASELAELPEVTQSAAPVALLFDYASDWTWKTLPQGADFDYFRLVFEVYRALRRLGLSVDILSPARARLDGYRLVLAPGLAQSPSDLQVRLRESGGICLLGPRANQVTEELTIPDPMGPALRGLKVTVRRVESLPPGTARAVEGGGAVVRWMEWLEGSAPVLFSCSNERPVLVGADGLYYLGGWPDAALWERVISHLAEKAGLPLMPLPEGLRLRDTGSPRFAFNYAPEPVTWDGQTLPPAGVAWLKL
jgi:beta-galactosidase